MQVKKVLVVSIYHMNFAEQDSGAACESFGPITKDGQLVGWLLENAGADEHRSWVLLMHPEIAKHDLSAFSGGLQQIIRTAITHGCTYIRFDMREPPIPNIPEYRH